MYDRHKEWHELSNNRMKPTSGEGCARPTGAHSRAMARGVLGRRSRLILVLDKHAVDGLHGSADETVWTNGLKRQSRTGPCPGGQCSGVAA